MFLSFAPRDPFGIILPFKRYQDYIFRFKSFGKSGGYHRGGLTH